MTPEPHDPVEVFYSYAHEDETLRDELKKHLSNLKRQGVITDWYDRDITAGSEWDDEIKQHLESARVILLLISPDFMDSDYIHEVEVKRAIERHEAGEARIIPVILRPVDWQGAPFSKLQSLPSDARPVTLWPNQDQAFLDVTKGIRKALEELSAPAVGIPASYDIPNPPKVGFISRRDRENQDLIERVSQELKPGKNHLVVLWGAGGVGKTAIAAEAVRGLIETFAGRVAWVSADGLESFSLSTLLDGIATQLGDSDLRKLPLELKNEQVRNLVKSTPTLVVLDNFETIDLSEQVLCIDWLGKPAPCTALITTRDKIEEAHGIPLEVMSAKEANILLGRLIAQTHEVGAFANLDRARLIQTAEANPLLLQWIVGQIDLAQDPDEVLDDLQHGEGTAADRVFNRSYELEQLNNGGRAVLLALSLFAPSAARKAVAEVAGLGKEKDKKKFKTAVRSLAALWLLRTTEESHRLAVEGLTRELTKFKLDSDPRSKIFRPRFVARFVQYAQSHSLQTREDYDALEVEKDNLLIAVDLAVTLKDGLALRALAGILAAEGMLVVRGYWDEALRVGKKALEISRNSKSQSGVGIWAHNVANMFHRRGELEQARRLWEESLEIAKTNQNKKATAPALHQLGMLAHSQNEFTRARSLYQESLSISNEVGDVDRVSTTLGALASLTKQEDQFEEAVELYKESIRLAEQIGNAAAVARGVNGLGLLALHRGEFDRALELINKSLEISKNLGSQSDIADSLHSLGSVALDQSNYREARALYQESLEIKKNLGVPHDVAVTLHQLGVLNLAEKDYDTSEQNLQKSLSILQNLGDDLGCAECIESLGNLQTSQGDLAGAEALYDKADAIAQRLGIRSRMTSLDYSRGLLAEKQGNKQLGIELLQKALKSFETLRSHKKERVKADLKRLDES